MSFISKSSVAGRVVAAALVIAIASIAGLAVYVRHTQGQARDTLRESLDRRAVLTARLIGSAFLASAATDRVREQYGGPKRSLALAIREGGDAPVVVLDAEGRILASRRPRVPGDEAFLRRSPYVRAALRGRPALSDAFRGRDGDEIIALALPIDTPSGRRVVVAGGPVEVVRNFADGFFTSASAIPGSQGYLLDGRGHVLAAKASSGGAGPRVPDRLRDDANGSHADHTFVSARVPSSQWRVVLSVPTKGLYASVDGGPTRAAWSVFAAFAFAILALLGLGVAAARGARRLAAATEREAAAQQLAHERLHDALTGLPNRTLFADRAQHALSVARRHGGGLAVAFVDVDQFKRINDSLGHEAGDAVLCEVARRLSGAVRATDTVSRFGGDEFVVLWEGVAGGEALRLASRLEEAVLAPVHLGARRVPITLSIGITMHEAAEAPLNAEDLVREADTAMYRAKERGRARVEVFDRELHQQAIERLDAEVRLRQAIEDDELLVHYQPIVSLPEGGLKGVEALVRWRDAQTGELVAPSEFIPLAEETGLVVELGAWVLRTAVGEVGEWARRGLVDDDFELSVNLSVRQLADRHLPDVVADALAGWDRAPSRLCLEITESAVMSDPATAEEMLARLNAMGVRLALDDFGVGHSSLGHLARSMPISTLKLDRSFVAGMTGPRDRGIVEAAASLARALHMTSVAEGVETPEQAAELASMGFPYAQGFHFGRPVEAAEIVRRLGETAGAMAPEPT